MTWRVGDRWQQDELHPDVRTHEPCAPNGSAAMMQNMLVLCPGKHLANTIKDGHAYGCKTTSKTGKGTHASSFLHN